MPAEFRLLSGEDEARLSARGVDLSIHNPVGVIGDLGGSSLELVRLTKGEVGRGAGDIGALLLVRFGWILSGGVHKRVYQSLVLNLRTIQVAGNVRNHCGDIASRAVTHDCDSRLVQIQKLAVFKYPDQCLISIEMCGWKFELGSFSVAH